MVATGSHRYHGQSAQRTAAELGDRQKENEKEREVEARLQLKCKDRGQRCQALTEEVQTLCFLQFLAVFELVQAKSPRVDLLGLLWIFYQKNFKVPTFPL